MEHRRSSITDELGINNNNKEETIAPENSGDPNAFLHEFLRSQQLHKHAPHPGQHQEEVQPQLQQTSIKIPSPGDPSAYFAPISPAAKTETPINPIMEMLRSGNAKSMFAGHFFFFCFKKSTCFLILITRKTKLKCRNTYVKFMKLFICVRFITN